MFLQMGVATLHSMLYVIVTAPIENEKFLLSSNNILCINNLIYNKSFQKHVLTIAGMLWVQQQFICVCLQSF